MSSFTASNLVLHARAGEVLSQAGFDERLAQGRGVHARQQAVQDLAGQDRLGVLLAGQEPVHGQHAQCLVVLAHGLEAQAQLPRGGERFLHAHRGVHGQGLEPVEILAQEFQPLLGVIIAVKEDPGVGRVVIGPVKIPEPLVGEVRDGPGVAARVQAVGRVREEGLLGLLGQLRVGGGIDALHLVVDHALDGKLRIPGGQVQVPAFLLEDLRGDAGEEDSVQVHVHQVAEVLQVLAGHGVAGLVRVGHGVQEGLQGPLEQVHEGLLDRVLARAAQHGVFKDVRHARGIGRRRADRDAENLVLIVVLDREDARSRLVMDVQVGLGRDLRDVRGGNEGETDGHGESSP
jgi:hypothetical protein